MDKVIAYDLETCCIRFWQKVIVQMMRDCGNIREAHTAFHWMQTIGVPMASVLGLNTTMIWRASQARYERSLEVMAFKKAQPRKKRRSLFAEARVPPMFDGPRPRRSRLKITKAEFLRTHEARWAALSAGIRA